jgi:hypothetical protein
MPSSTGVDQATLQEEGVQATDLGVDDLTSMLMALNRK